jgi:solute carrier family 25 carnitine/acylcarnitine transporter 20/29
MVREEGVGALFKGVGPALLRAFPANAACFLGMELSMSALNKWF